MKRYTHITNGARVQVRDDKVMDSSWVPEDQPKAAASSPDSGYEGMKVADLKAEIDRRNEGRDEADRVSSEGKKADLVAALEADDTALTE
ncbi:SAP domain-containing protein [Micromonospora chokoriensis]